MNDKIAKWILNGRFPKDLNDAERRAYGVFTYRNNKPFDDTDAVVLLPVLVARGYFVHMDHQGNHWWFATRNNKPEILRLYESTAPTMAKAITKTLVQLIESI